MQRRILAVITWRRELQNSSLEEQCKAFVFLTPRDLRTLSNPSSNAGSAPLLSTYYVPATGVSTLTHARNTPMTLIFQMGRLRHRRVI